MAIVTQFLGSSQGADLSMVLDDVKIELLQVIVDCTNAIGPVIVTVYKADGVTPQIAQTFQPGTNTTINVPNNAKYTLVTVTDRHGVDHLALTAPLWSITGA
jgi:hypothetical protein